MTLGQKSVVDFLGDLKTPKIHSEINRPLASIQAIYIHKNLIAQSQSVY